MFFVFQSFDLQKKKFTAVVHVIIAIKKNDFERIKLINVLSLLYFCLCTCVPFDVYFKKTNFCQLKLHLTFKRYKHIYQEMAYPASKEWENDHSKKISIINL